MGIGMTSTTNLRIALSLPEVARALGVSRSSIYRRAKDGRVPTVRLGRRLVVPLAALDELLSEAQASGSSDPVLPEPVEVQPSPGRASRPLSDLTRKIRADLGWTAEVHDD